MDLDELKERVGPLLRELFARRDEQERKHTDFVKLVQLSCALYVVLSGKEKRGQGLTFFVRSCFSPEEIGGKKVSESPLYIRVGNAVRRGFAIWEQLEEGLDSQGDPFFEQVLTEARILRENFGFPMIQQWRLQSGIEAKTRGINMRRKPTDSQHIVVSPSLFKPQKPTIPREIKSACRHYWVIEPANGPISKGVCRFCGEIREFKNSVGEEPHEEYVPQKQGEYP